MHDAVGLWTLFSGSPYQLDQEAAGPSRQSPAAAGGPAPWPPADCPRCRAAAPPASPPTRTGTAHSAADLLINRVDD